MTSLLQHLVQTVLDALNAAEAPEGPPHTGVTTKLVASQEGGGPVVPGELEPTEPRCGQQF